MKSASSLISECIVNIPARRSHNFASWLLRMGKERDVTINLRHIMDFGNEAFEIYIMNDNVVITDMTELLKTAGRYV